MDPLNSQLLVEMKQFLFVVVFVVEDLDHH
jgi:hypothetical protein